MTAKKGDFVRIYNVILNPEDRSPNLPEDTKKTALQMWVKGFLLEDGKIGDIVNVETITGRKISGKLVDTKPVYRHNYGEFIPELLKIGIQAKEILFGGNEDDK